MKTTSKFSFLILCILLLSACGGTASATPEAALQNVYTAAAMTLSVQASTPTATITAMPTTQVLPTYNTLPTSTTASLVSYSSVSTANGCNNAIYVSDVTITDGTVLAPGEAFTKTWKFQNTGTCDWDEDYLIVFVSGSDMDGETTEIDQDVLSGATGNISVSLIAPSTEGTYTGYWRLATSDSAAFGQSVYVQIVVSDDASTATPTATATDTTESTSTPTATTQPTSTFTATSAPTSVPTEALTPAAE
jgi:hypothetical protein